MRRILSLLLILALLLGGCAAPQKGEKSQIICTLFATYDWTRNILGKYADQFDLDLLGGGVDLHSFEPSALDYAHLQQADLLICNGGTSEDWLPKEQGNLLNLADHCTLLNLPHEHTEEEHEHTADEHTWLSIDNAKRGVDAIAEALGNLAPELKAEFLANATTYKAQLSALENNYQAVCDKAKNRTLIFADRYPFRYLAADYDLTCYAAFDGCSAETEASASTITMLADAIRDHQPAALLILEGSKQDLAQTVLESCGREDLPILAINSMQSMGQKETEQGSYIGIMTENLEILKKAMN